MFDNVCPHCHTDWWTQDCLHFNCDIRTRTDDDDIGVDAYLVYQPCCEENQAHVEWYGFKAVHGKTLVEITNEISCGAYDVLDITEDADATLVCRLRICNPTVVTSKTDKHGHFKPKGPSGWQGRVFEVVDEHHRHHDAPQGWKYGMEIFNGPIRVGVATVGNPLSRMLMQTQPNTLEVIRVCTYGKPQLTKNASSKLYSECAKQAKKLGYKKMITYTLFAEESGHSLVASGWVPTNVSEGGSWSRNGRKRDDKGPTNPKVRWERGLDKNTRREIEGRRVSL